jgi:hypothetical protein
MTQFGRWKAPGKKMTRATAISPWPEDKRSVQLPGFWMGNSRSVYTERYMGNWAIRSYY